MYPVVFSIFLPFLHINRKLSSAVTEDRYFNGMTVMLRLKTSGSAINVGNCASICNVCINCSELLVEICSFYMKQLCILVILLRCEMKQLCISAGDLCISAGDNSQIRRQSPYRGTVSVFRRQK